MRIFYFTGAGLKPIIWLTLVLLTIGVNAQTSDTPEVSKKGRTISSDEADLMDLDKAWIDAEVNHDKAALEHILEDRFLATFTSGKTVDRTEFIEGVMKMTISPFEVIHDVIRIHGDTCTGHRSCV